MPFCSRVARSRDPKPSSTCPFTIWPHYRRQNCESQECGHNCQTMEGSDPPPLAPDRNVAYAVGVRRIDHKAVFKARINELIAELGDGSPERFAAEIRLPARNMGRYAQGEVLPRLGDAVLIAKRSGVSLDWLTGLSDQRDVMAVPVPDAPPPRDTSPPAARPQQRRGGRPGNGSRRRSS